MCAFEGDELYTAGRKNWSERADAKKWINQMRWTWRVTELIEVDWSALFCHAGTICSTWLFTALAYSFLSFFKREGKFQNTIENVKTHTNKVTGRQETPKEEKKSWRNLPPFVASSQNNRMLKPSVVAVRTPSPQPPLLLLLLSATTAGNEKRLIWDNVLLSPLA